MAASFRDQRFVVVDVETSGLSPRVETVIEIGLSVHEGGREVRSYQSLIGPGQRVPHFITQLTGIRQRDLERAPLFCDVEAAVSLCFAGVDFFVAHNVAFDRSFLEVAFTECRRELPQRPWVDPVPLARRHLGFAKLTKLSAHYGLSHEGAHHALDDARVTAEVLYRLADALHLSTLAELLSGVPAAPTTAPTTTPTPSPPTTSPTTSPTTTATTTSTTTSTTTATTAARLKLFR